MKNIYLVLCIILLSHYSFGQLSNITYSVKTVNITSHENAIFGSCYEIGDEEYTGYLFSWDNVDGNQTSTGCQTCDNNGDCAYAGNIPLQTRTNDAYTLGFSIDAWEDDNGDRCSYETCTFCNDDDCHRSESNTLNLRESSFPSNGYTNTPTWGSSDDHEYTFQYTWNYSGTSNFLTPTCTPQSTGYSAGAIRSWSTSLTSGITYRFSSCGSGEDTYIRIYGPDGFTIVATGDDNGPDCSGNSASVDFTPLSTSIYYIELSHFTRAPLNSSGSLSYYITNRQVNDACGNAIAISDGNYPYATYCASQDAPAQNCGGANVHNDIWYTYTPAGSGILSVYNCGSNNYDSRISIYSGSCGALNYVSCNNDACGSGSSSSVQVCKGLTYYISVGGYNGATGTGILSVSFIAVNNLPSITCPSNLSVNAATGTCAATVNYTAPVGTDDCPGPLSTLISGQASGTTFPAGITTNTFRVTDIDGGTATCSFTVTVVDNQLPVISCPANQTLIAPAGTCSISTTYTAPTGTDNCGGASTTQIAGQASNTSFAVGVTTNTFKVTAANGQTTTCSFTVTVIDNQLPTISCPPNQSGFNTAPGTCAATATYVTPVGTDNCGGAVTTLITGQASGTGFPGGVTTNTFKVTDGSGNTATCSFTISVQDGQPPSILCPSNQTIDAAMGTCAAIVTYTTPIGTDNCSGVSTILIAGQASGSSFPVGNTINTFKVTALNSQTASCSFTVTVNDTQVPTIICPANLTINAAISTCAATASYVQPIGTDNCSGSTTIQIAGQPSGTSFPVGTTINSFRVTDAVGLIAQCDFSVTVIDAEPPVFSSCQGNISTTIPSNLCLTVVNYTTPVGTDNCSGVSTARVTGLASGSAFPAGVTTVTYVATDAHGATTSCSFTVTVNNNHIPTINCPNNINVSTEPGKCFANVIYTAPVGTDNCSGSSTTQISGGSTGTNFNAGITANTYMVTAGNGQTATCTFSVMVNDFELPGIACAANVNNPNDPGLCSAIVSLIEPTISDNCGIAASPTNNHVSTTFPVGSTNVIWSVTDVHGNTNSCVQTVLVNDSEAPTILCGADQTQSADIGGCSAFVLVNGPTFDDNCAGASGVTVFNDYTFFEDASADYPAGTTYVTWTATDNVGNQSFCVQTITITDDELPTITCSEDIIVNNVKGQCDATITLKDPIVTDNCGTTLTNNHTSSIYTGGTTLVTWTVTDPGDNTATCIQRVTVNDIEAPTISCPSNVTQDNGANTCGAVVTYITPLGTDNCSGATTVQRIGQASGTTFPVGITTNTFTVTDAFGNSASCSFSVTISDTEAPVIICPANIVQGMDPGSCDAVVNYIAPEGTDNCPGEITVMDEGSVSGTTLPKGTTTNTFSVTDAEGLTSSCSFTVTINDTEAPVITCPGNITKTNEPGTCGAVATYTSPAGTDNCPGVSTVFTSGLISGSTFSGGITTNTFTATDASGNSTSCSFTVTVNDVDVPKIVCPANITKVNDAGICGAIISYTLPTGTDNCPGATTVLTTGFASGATFPAGTTINTFKVTDEAGNTASCSFTVTISDAEAPVIVCPSNITQGNDAGTCGAVVTYTAPTGTDNCAGASTAQTGGLASGQIFPGGTTTNTFVVTDAAGHTASCSFTITIGDTQAPVITCPSNIIHSNDAGTCSAVITYTAPVGTDNCPGSTTLRSAGLASGSSFPAGTTTNTFVVTDAAGNTVSCSFTVTINDTELPAITCPLNITRSNDAGTCSAAVTYTAPTGTDNCTGATTTQTSGLASGSIFPKGITTNTFRVTDASANTATCSFTVTITDNEKPVITCPATITQNSDAGSCGSVVTYTAPTGTDNCTGATTAQINGLASGATFPAGNTINTFTVTDAAGNTASCSFTVTINDVAVPVITCPGNITQSNDAGICGAVVTYTAPTGTDNCAGASTRQTSGLASGNIFPVGTTTNIFVVTDAAGNTASCSFTVAISDGQVPLISCPGNISRSNDVGACGAAITYTTPSGTDNCAGATTAQTGGSSSGSIFPVGTTTNTFVVTDAAGNTASCSFTVAINDTELPAITCPSNITQSNDAGTCSAAVTYIAPTGTDNCTGATTTQTVGFASGNIFPIGTTTNTFVVTDAAGNTSSCHFTITINDTQSPVIVCPAAITQSSDAGTCGAIVTYTAPTETDNCTGATTAQTAGLASGNTFPSGTTTNTFVVTDAAGNSTSCSFTVTITDALPPVISCQANISKNNDAGICGAVVSFTAPSGTDNCPGATTAQTVGLASGNIFPVGTTTNTFVVTDAAGNTASCSFTVTINDTELPVITCPANITRSNDAGTCGAVVNYTAPTGTDNCTGATTSQTVGVASGNIFSIGTTTNTFVVTDAAGNTASCSFTVTVSDTELPAITCPSNITRSNDAGTCGAAVIYTAPTGTDNCAGATTAQTAGLASGNTFPSGITTNTFIVTDAAGNTSSCSFTVTISDTELPSITCGGNLNQSEQAGTCGAVVNFTAPIGTDNCSGATTSQTSGLASGETFPSGITTNVFTVTDASGNTASCSFTVTISDTELPAITCPSNITRSNDANACGAVITYTAPSGTDNCPGAATVQTSGLASGATFPTGTTTNIFKVTDAAGNTATCSFTVSISDTQAPVIACPGNITESNDAGTCGAVVNYTAPTGTDNCAGATTSQTVGVASGNIFSIGTTTNTFVVTDAAGNTASCSFTVTINDTELPAITCPSNITRSNDAGTCGALVNYTAPNGTDNCTGVVTIQTGGLASGATFPSGTTTNVFTVTDAAGNSATCSFAVTITDAVAPVIVCSGNITQSNDAGSCGAIVSYTTPSGTDNCSGATTSQTSGLASGETFPSGITTNVFTVTDASGNTATCSFTVTISDTELPAITCPSNITRSNDANACGAVITYTAPSGTDNCPGAATVQTSGLASGATFPTGTTTNIFKVTDAAGNTATCSFTVSISDTQAPVIACPGNITESNDAGTCGAVVNYTAPTGTDNCAGATTTQTVGFASGNIFPVGMTTNTFVVTDAAGSTASCSFVVTISDAEAPVITCPGNIVQSGDAGTCGTVINYSTPTGTDNCQGANTAQSSGLPSGSTFPTGITTNTFVVTDAAGNSTSCSFTVTISNSEIPVITCPSNITQSTDVGICGATVTYTTPEGIDNCPGATTVQTSGLSSGVTFPTGTTINVFKVTDASGNTATCSFTVSVNDDEAPVIICPGDITQISDAGSCSAVVNYTAPTGTDNCSGATTAQTGGLASGATFPSGTTTNIFTVTDAAGNTATCTQTVTVTDNIKPTITCPADITVSPNAACTATGVNLGTPATADNCSVASVTNNAPSVFPTGVTVVVWTVTDAAGNTATCSQTVTVTDNIKPTITCPSNITASPNAGCTATGVDLGTPATADNCSVASVTNDAPSVFPAGTTVVVWTVTDGAGNTATCSQTVTVTDNIKPTITCPANITASPNAGCTATGVDLGTPATADNCSVASVTNNHSGTTYPAGTTVVVWTVTDAAGNTATCSQTVTVTDNIKPTITCPANITASPNAGCTATGVDLGTPATADNCSVASVTNDAPSVFSAGTTVVTWTVTDAAGNTATCSQTVTVTDNIKPTITCPSNITASPNAGCTATGVDLGTPSTADNCSVASVTNDAPSVFPAGATVVTWTVTDAAGNTATCSQTVTVTDNIKPTITCPANITASPNAGCTATGVNLGTPATADNCSVASVINDAPSVFSAGTTVVTWTVTDGAGNTATCSQTVTVTDNIKPTITCPANITASPNAGCTATGVDLGTPATADNCSVASVINDAPSVFSAGTTVVTWTVTDAAGNTATCSQTVTVTDNIKPTITCPANITTSPNSGCTATGVDIGTPATADNCSVASVTNNAPSVFQAGVTVVTWTVTDAAGNTATCSQTVTVTDNIKPTITCPANITASPNAGCTATGVDLGTPATADNCSVASVINNHASTTYPAGTTVVVWTVTDAAGNTATCSQTVTVTDNVKPTITCPSNITASPNAGCTATGVNLGTPATADNCSVASVTNDAPSVFSVGVTIVTWTVTDAAGNTATCSQTVTVTDNIKPTITCPDNITASPNAGCTATGVNLGTPATADNCSVASVTNDAPSVFSAGTTVVTWTVTDAAGNTATCSQTVTVTDNIKPTITCPDNITASPNSGCTATGVDLGTPATADNCSVASVTNDAPSVFPAGVTVVTWTVTDGAGNTATCSQTVTVTDNIKPTITCPSNITASPNAGCTATGVDLGTPATSDNCSVASVTNDAPSVFPAGTIVVTWTVTDAAGNTATCSQTVTVTDNIKPTITCPSNITASPNAGCTATGVDIGTPATSDNCSVASVTNDAPSVFPAGTTVVTWTVTDAAGNTATCSQTVTVTDNVKPTITCPANITASPNAGCTATGVDLGTPATADNCSVASVTNDAPSVFPAGTTVVTWTVTDAAGNTATCSQTVTVTDNIKPTITCPANITASPNAGCTATGVDLGTPSTADNCSVASVTNDAPSVFQAGVTVVVWTVTDAAGNTATCTQTVTVTDNVKPTITCPANITASPNSGCTATGVNLGTPATADNCSVASVTNDAPSVFSAGTTVVVWTVTDGAGNTATCAQTVTVTDNVKPTITCPSNITASPNAGCTATGVDLGTPATADNCSVASVTNDAPSVFSAGVTVVTWTVTDGAGNTATCSQTVTVTDNIKPTITCPANITASPNAGCTATGVDLGTPATADNCSVASVTNDAPSVFQAGTTVVTWTVTDAAGNTATCSQTVTVTDNIKPTITCPANITASPNAGCTATGVDLGTPATADNCSVASVTNDAPSVFPAGTTVVTWTVTDAAGNTATCGQTVTVTDNVKPTITCPANITSSPNSGCTATGVNFGTPATADNCSVASVTNDAPSVFPAGTTVVVWTVTDAAGNTATCYQTVTVTDDIKPTITCPANITASPNAGCTATGVNLGTPATADNCSVASVTNDAPSVFSVGVTAVTWTVTDGAGNTATCSQTVTVTDNIKPTITCPANITVSPNAGCTATGVDLGTPATADNCSVASVTNNHASTTYPAGTTVVVWTVTDGAGNTATCSQTVTVTDNIKPTITCPANITASPNAGCTATGVDLGTPATADNCSVASVTNNAPSVFQAGVTVVTWTVTDAAGNTATCSQTVTVTDNIKPTITCPSNITASPNAGCTATGVNLGTPATADNCSVASVTNNHASTTYPAGVTVVVWTVTDGAGNTATCAQTVTVTDNVKPTITCPSNITVSPNAGCTATGVNLGTPATADNCSVASVTNNHASTTYSAGTTIVVWTVTDAAGNTATCTQTVTVTDNIKPTITCPSNITASPNAGCTATGVDLGTPATADNCSVASVTNNHSSTTYPAGTTVVVWTVTDGAGNTATCAQTVTVTDNIKPTITCPANITASPNAGCTATGVNLGTPATADNCSVASVTNNHSGPTYPAGTTVVVWTVTDAAGNTATCSQTVTVTDNVKPTITCPANITASPNSGCTATGVNLGTPATADNCSVASVTNNHSGPTYPAGTTIVVWTVTDAAGNTATCSQTVTVTDNIKPTITCPANITVAPNSGCSATGVKIGIPVTADNCSVASVTNDHSGTTYSSGVTIVTWTVTDAAGNTATCAQTVTVTDKEKPKITCPGNRITVTTSGCTATGVFIGTPQRSDNCTVASVTNNAPAVFPLGITTVTWTVADAAGNTASCTQSITVRDSVKPVITCPANVITFTNAACTATNVNLGTPATSDNCSVASVTNNHASSTYPVGTTTVRWTVTDGTGNAAICTHTVTVTDNIKPTISCPANITSAPNSGCNATGIKLGNPATSDNCSVASVTNDHASNAFSSGVTVVTWTVKDGSGNTATCNQSVTITDNVKPTITCPGNRITVTTSGCTASNVFIGTPQQSDNCTVASVTNNAPSVFPLGITTVTWTVADGAGNTASCTQSITVRDSVKPVITCPANVITFTNAACTATNVNLGTPATSDNCSVASVINNHASTTYPLGTTTVRWTVTDGTGNATFCTHTVTVTDNVKPVISCPANKTAVTNSNCTATGVNLGNPATSDNCSVANVSNDHASGTYPSGVTTVTWTVKDASNNTASCTQTVTVTDITKPVASCKNTTVTLVNGTTTVTPSQVNQNSSDACGIKSLSVFPNTFTCANAGANTVTLTVTDNSNNTSTCHAVVTVSGCPKPAVMATSTDGTAGKPWEDATAFMIKAYPNPFSNEVHLRVYTLDTKTPVSIKIFDASGQIIESKDNISYELGDMLIGKTLPAGMYLIQVTQGRNIQLERVVKTE